MHGLNGREKKYLVTTRFEAKNLGCSRNDRTLFSGLNLSVEPGQVLLLEGENGSGKTTLLRILCGYRQQDQGQLLWNGKAITEIADYFQYISYVGHKNGIKDELTVEENLEMMASMMSVSAPKIKDVLKQIGLFKYSDVITRQLSAGQKRKLALARLLMTSRPFWMLDEPFTSLDKSSVRYFESVIREHIQRNGMLILTSHHEVDLAGLTVNRFDLSASSRKKTDHV